MKQGESASSPVVLAIAATDPGGGAGLTADVRILDRLGVHPASVVTAITVQTTEQFFTLVPLEPELVYAQVEAVCQDLAISAIKIGAVGTGAIAQAIAEALEAARCKAPLVLDPVAGATVGGSLAEGGSLATVLAPLLARATLVTPNPREATLLTGVEQTSPAEYFELLRPLGVEALLLKSYQSERGSEDVLVTPEGKWELSGPKVDYEVHGTGCALASAIAGLLARGVDLLHAVRQARALVLELMIAAEPLGKGDARIWRWPPA